MAARPSGLAITVSAPFRRTVAPDFLAASRVFSSFDLTLESELISLNSLANSPSCGVSTTGALYKRTDAGYELLEPKKLDAEYVANASQVRSTVDPAKEEALATHLNGDAATVAFRFEVDWTAPDSTEVQTTRSMIFESDHEKIATADLAKELKE